MRVNNLKTDDEYERWFDRGVLNTMRENLEDIFMDFENNRPATVIGMGRDRFLESNQFVE